MLGYVHIKKLLYFFWTVFGTYKEHKYIATLGENTVSPPITQNTPLWEQKSGIQNVAIILTSYDQLDID